MLDTSWLIYSKPPNYALQCDVHVIPEGVCIPKAEGVHSDECSGTNPGCNEEEAGCMVGHGWGWSGRPEEPGQIRMECMQWGRDSSEEWGLSFGNGSWHIPTVMPATSSTPTNPAPVPIPLQQPPTAPHFWLKEPLNPLHVSLELWATSQGRQRQLGKPPGIQGYPSRLWCIQGGPLQGVSQSKETFHIVSWFGQLCQWKIQARDPYLGWICPFP